MMRSRPNTDSVDDVLDPAIQAELDQLDAALRGEPIEDDVLAAIVRDVQATAPEMPSDLRRQLRHDVAGGFAKGGARGRASTALGRTGRRAGATGGSRRRTSFAYGGGLAVTLVLLVGVGAFLTTGPNTKSLDLGDDAAQTMSAAPSSAAVDQAQESAGDVAASAAPNGAQAEPMSAEAAKSAGSSSGAVARGSSSTPATGQRRVEQNVLMAVEVKSGKLPEATSKVEDIVRLGGGYVANSSVSTQSRGAGSATYTLKIASSQLDRTLKRLGDLGTVTNQEQSSRDITSSFDSVEQRLGDNKEVRAALLRSLAKAETDGQIAALNRRLADNRRTRQSLESQLARLKTRTNLTTVALSLNAPAGDAPSADDDGNWSIGDAASDAVSALGTVTGILLVGAAVLLPFAILAAIAWALYRVRRKRSRESALGD